MRIWFVDRQRTHRIRAATALTLLFAAMVPLEQGQPGGLEPSWRGGPPLVGGSRAAPPASRGADPIKDWPRADVVVVGGGTSGIAAAITARRQGAGRVVLMEATDYLGGQVAAGVGTMDEGHLDRADQRQEGIWRTIQTRFLAEYRRLGWPHASTCYGSGSLCVSPSVGRRVYTRMLDEAGVTLQLGVDATPVLEDGRIAGVRWTSSFGRQASGGWATSLLIDATEYGDLVAAAGAPYRSGKGMGNVAGDRPEGHLQSITYAAVVRKYSPGAMPAGLKLRGKPFPVPVGDPDPAATRARVLAHFQRKVVPGGLSALGIDTTEPWASVMAVPMNAGQHLRYRGLPDPGKAPYHGVDVDRISRTVLNFANDWPRPDAGDLGGQWMPVAHLEDPEFRRSAECQAKLRSVQFVWYMQNVLGQPQWSVADDEGFNTPYNRDHRCSGIVPERFAAFEANMPLRPYVRESRRGLGLTTISVPRLFRVRTGEPTTGRYGQTSAGAQAGQDPDTVAVGYYGFDLHGAYLDEDLEQEFESHADRMRQSRELLSSQKRADGPFGIPLRSLVSRDVGGLILAEKNISQTRLAAAATRLQPETTLVGAAAGTLAAVARLTGLDPREVPAEKVQHRLARTGQHLATNRFLDLRREDPATRAFELAALANLYRAERHTSAGQSAPVNRAHAVAWIRRALGLARVPDVTKYRDVGVAAWYAPDVEALRRLGIPLSCGPTKFCPTASITRADYIILLARAMDAHWDTGFTRAGDPTRGRFTDLPRGKRSAIIHAMTAHARSHGVPFGSAFRPAQPLQRRYAALWTAWERFDPRFPH